MFDFFKSREKREAERRQKLREGKIRIQMAMKREAALAQRIESLVRRALDLEDDAQFRQLGKRLLAIRDDIRHKERYLLSIDSLEAYYDQTRASTEFLIALRDLSDTMIGTDDPQNAAHLRREAEEQLARVQGMSDRIEVLLELASDQLGPDPHEDERLKELEQSLRSGSRSNPGATDGDIDESTNPSMPR